MEKKLEVKEDKNMTYIEMISKTGLRTIETPETLENRFNGMDGRILEYDNMILVAGFYWNGFGQDNYFGAVYDSLEDGELDAETRMELMAVSGGFFKDEGHAIAWAMGNTAAF